MRTERNAVGKTRTTGPTTLSWTRPMRSISPSIWSIRPNTPLLTPSSLALTPTLSSRNKTNAEHPLLRTERDQRHPTVVLGSAGRTRGAQSRVVGANGPSRCRRERSPTEGPTEGQRLAEAYRRPQMGRRAPRHVRRDARERRAAWRGSRLAAQCALDAAGQSLQQSASCRGSRDGGANTKRTAHPQPRGYPPANSRAHDS